MISHENIQFLMILKVQDSIFIKIFRLRRTSLPGVAFSGEQPPAARCAGASRRKKIVKSYKYIQIVINLT